MAVQSSLQAVPGAEKPVLGVGDQRLDFFDGAGVGVEVYLRSELVGVCVVGDDELNVALAGLDVVLGAGVVDA
ncbi:uncharacterized protein PgNI_00583 [Pyricularia grisea]|uniref:Uncharacterized protein n=1 Tax=Pyricularia grisea TaxID=148305 RepID=A0A6P8BFT3_PYRGI|nr:uncharacterized protein PgNI_00583 [Pyricularia grisea]TLD15575.1 hypothetical protein PgNI_00583 [Pyricularia grisea]